MKIGCEVIRDLLPLYADDACSKDSRLLVEEHLQDCTECEEMLEKLKNSEMEEELKSEKEDVISYAVRQFKRQSAKVGSTVSGLFMIPILAFLVINLVAGSAMGWFFIMLASLVVAGSLILTPILAHEDKAFWTLCAFTVSLMVLLGVICLVSGGNWFWLVASAVLFGLSAIFLPFAIKAGPMRKLIGNRNKALIVIVTDVVLFLNMMSSIAMRKSNPFNIVTLLIGCAVGIVLAMREIRQRKGE